MVARISFPKRLLAAINYNENKCSKGNAVCIAATNYLQEAKEMNFYQKLSLLESRNELNDRATTKSIHVSLNFDPSEKLNEEQLRSIANAYMQKIGFGAQPFLVYQHHDAGHPHVHIVSTTIKEDGSRINTHNIGRTVSEKSRKEIEQEFGLVRAEKPKPSSKEIKAINAEKIIYGKTELKRSTSNVVNEAFHHYRFCSLPEFNAALKQFNVIADRGKKEGRIYKNGGLVYRVLDEKANKIGVPIKASLLSSQPTLKSLEKKYERNKELKEPFKERLKNVIGDELKSSNNLELLMEGLKKKNINVVLRQNDEGRIYGITFVDNEKKVVFNGSDLGREYSAASFMKRFEVTKDTKISQRTQSEAPVTQHHSSPFQMEMKFDDESKNESLVEDLMSPQVNKENVPFQLRRKKKKKLKPGHKEH